MLQIAQYFEELFGTLDLPEVLLWNIKQL
jgi:hypothetical protein